MLHREILTDSQSLVLARLGKAACLRQFYLAGGTALALRLGHRRSVDLDLFVQESFGDPEDFITDLNREGLDLDNQRLYPATVYGELNGVQLSFIQYQYPLLNQPAVAEEFGCKLASLDDIACMKLAAIATRGSRKDFVDIYALVLKHMPLRFLLDKYTLKHGKRDLAPVLYGLNYFDDAEREPMPHMLWAVSWDAIKRQILSWVRQVV